MVLETAQLLSSALLWSGCDDAALYKDAHPHGHPCKDWAMASRTNFLWLAELGLALHDEWVWRGFNPHGSLSQIKLCKRLAPAIVQGRWTPPALSMPPQFWRPDTTEAYQNYYCGAKAWHPKRQRVGDQLMLVHHPATWRRRGEPVWWEPYQERPEDVPIPPRETKSRRRSLPEPTPEAMEALIAGEV